MAKSSITEIEDVQEPFCGCLRRNMVTLAVKEPEIAAQWAYKKNHGWGPDDFSHGSGVNAWWVCPDCKREYKMQICLRTCNGRCNCPYCAGRRVSPENALSSLFPKIASQWHPTKNKKLKSADVVAGSHKIVWWLCKEKGHVWKQGISVRTRNELGCPECYRDRMREAANYSERDESGRIVLGKQSKKGNRLYYEVWDKKYVPLSRSHPRIAKEWHPTKNGPFKPADFSTSAGVVAWWKCDKGVDHVWQSSIGVRTHKGSRGQCPFCNNTRASATNSIKALFPNLAKEWHPTKNKSLRPEAVVAGSTSRVWWQCRKDKKHQWQTAVYNRTRTGTRSGCPYCARRKVSDLNSLKKLYPKMAAQFHPTKNWPRKVSEIAVASTIQVWWFCDKGPDHEWRTSPSSRTSKGTNCPFCSGRQVSVTNSLATLFPHIAAQWDYKRNGDLTPQDVTCGTPRKVWWLCEKGHNWQTYVYLRTKTKGECWECRTGKPRQSWSKTQQP